MTPEQLAMTRELIALGLLPERAAEFAMATPTPTPTLRVALPPPMGVAPPRMGVVLQFRWRR